MKERIHIKQKMHKFTYLKTLGLEKTLRNKFENKTKQINDNLFHHV